MGGLSIKRILGYEPLLAGQLKKLAAQALQESDLDEIMELAGARPGEGVEAGEALKAVLAERIAEYIIKAMGEARKRKMRLGAAAIVIAAR